ncbi:glycosyl transferase family 2, partial [Trypanosoma theileri]
QPTYRGLFQKAISTYPSAKAIMYANMDILFTSSLARTVDKVRRVYEAKKKTQTSLKGWFVVGRRTNISVPANWTMDGERWETRMETELVRSGRLFFSYG